MKEYWDIYDKNRIFQNRTILRGTSFKEGDYYVCCEIMVQNPLGEILITQRNPNKKAGGLWEFIGGGVLAGETTIQAAVREVKEEIGVNIKESDLSFLLEYKQRNYFMDIYLVKKDVKVCDIILNAKETVNAKWVSETELQKIIASNEMVRSVARRYIMLKDKF